MMKPFSKLDQDPSLRASCSLFSWGRGKKRPAVRRLANGRTQLIRGNYGCNKPLIKHLPHYTLGNRTSTNGASTANRHSELRLAPTMFKIPLVVTVTHWFDIIMSKGGY